MLNTTQITYQDSIAIIKSGSDPSLSANVTLEVRSQAFLDSAYNISGKNYKVLPQDVYKFNGSSEVDFNKNEKGKWGVLTINAKQLFKYIQQNPTVQFVLPIQLNSQRDSIYQYKSSMLVKVNVKEPTVEIGSSQIEDNMIYKSLDVKVNAAMSNIEKNQWDFDCSLVTLNDSETSSLVNDYNVKNGTNYEILPSGSFSMTAFNFKKDVNESQSTVTVKRDKLVNDHSYLLPLRLASGKSVVDGLAISNDIVYIIIHNPKYGYVIPDRSNWKILFCNEDNKFGGATGADGAGAPAMIDNDINTYWMYARANDYAWESYFNGDDYDYNFKDYHAFFGDRWYGDGHGGKQVIVIDMKESSHIMDIGIIQRQDADCYLVNASFAVSDDKEFKFLPQKSGGTASDYNDVALNNWTPVFTWNGIPQQKGISWKVINTDELHNHGMKGRFLKVMPLLGSWGGSYHGSCIAEIKVMQLLAIDGVAI